MTYERWYEDIPYGPVTRENFNLLGVSFFDSGSDEAQKAAKARGIEKGDYLRVRFAELVAQGSIESSPQDVCQEPITPPDQS